MLGFTFLSSTPLSTLLPTAVDVTVSVNGVGLSTVSGVVNVTGDANIDVVTNTLVDPMQVTLGVGEVSILDISWIPVDDSQTALWVDVIPRN